MCASCRHQDGERAGGELVRFKKGYFIFTGVRCQCCSSDHVSSSNQWLHQSVADELGGGMM